MLTLADLEADLQSDDTDSILDAAWKAFDVVDRIAGAVTCDGRSDDGLAMLVSTHCEDGRSQLPLPLTPGQLQAPVPDSGSGTGWAAWIEPYVALLRQVQQCILRLAAFPENEAYAVRLASTAEQAEACADLLPGLRQGEGAPT